MLGRLVALFAGAALVAASTSELEARTIPTRFLADIFNCGSSGNRCGCNDPNAFATCSGGSCGQSCYSNCFLSRLGSCQPNLPSSCGVSGAACKIPKSNGKATCTSGVCGISCNANTQYDATANDCVPLSTKSCCGISGTQCIDPDNGDATCVLGVCKYTCDSGYYWDSADRKCQKNAVGYSVTRCPVALGFLGTEDCTKKFAGLTNGNAYCTVIGCVFSCNAGYQSKSFLSAQGILESFLGGGASYSCVENTSNSNCCGNTGKQCVAPANGSAQCKYGNCVYSCNNGYDYDDDKDMCVKVDTPVQCGRCGNTCYAPNNGYAICKDGQCSWMCNNGYSKSGNCCILNGSPKAKAKKIRRSNNSESICPMGEQACPVSGSASLQAFTGGQALFSQESLIGAIQSGTVGYECIDTQTSIESCGGCASTGSGKDCSAIPHALGVGCEAGQCVVLECAKGYRLSTSGESCVRTHISRHQHSH